MDGQAKEREREKEKISVSFDVLKDQKREAVDRVLHGRNRSVINTSDKEGRRDST